MFGLAVACSSQWISDIAPEGWWDDEERPQGAVDVAADVTKDASDSLILASQHYEDAAAAATASTEEEDQLLLLASQQYENANAMAAESPDTSTSARFGVSVTLESIDQLITSKVEEKIRKTTRWANSVWRECAVFLKSTVMQDERAKEATD